MKKVILTATLSTLFMGFSTGVIANEINTTSWSFPTPDQIHVSQNRMLLFCDANPYKCPVGLRATRSANANIGGGGAGGGSLVSPASNSSANNISVVITGDNSSASLSTSQDAKDNNMTSNSNADAEIDLDQVLNYENNYK
jgi:hypothetical protein